MDILRKQLAPISDAAWDEINETAKEIFTQHLSARRFVDVDGPKGLDFAAVNTGRLDVPKNQKSKVHYGINQVLPLVETRANFSLDLWELDNIYRGAEDIDVDSLEDAVKEISAFEENAIYNGFSKAGIKGLKEMSDYKAMNYPDEGTELLKILAEGIGNFQGEGVEGPYSLVVNQERWQKIISTFNGYPLEKQIMNLLDGNIIVSGNNIKESFLITERGGDFRLTTGLDFSIGYLRNDGNKVDMYLTESFTFQVIDPAAVIVIK